MNPLRAPSHSQPQTAPASPDKHSPVGHDEFHSALSSAFATSPKVKEFVHQYEPHEYQNMKTFLHPDKKSGFAVKPDGDIVSVFSTEKGRGDEIVQHAKREGGKKLDAFDGYLPKLYGKHGFKEYSREKNWTPGAPDVVYMRLHPFAPKGPLLGKHEEKYLRPLSKSESNIQDEYKKNARKQCGILFPVKIKGRSRLSDEIKLHMSLKCFNSKDEFSIAQVKDLVKELHIEKPDLKGVTFKPTIFTNEKTKNTYFMLILEGLDPKFKKFCEAFKGVGVTHAKFMSHITIDKALYDQIKKDGIKAEDLKFDDLVIEHGAGNLMHSFAKSEVLEKGPIKNTLVALGVAGAVAAAPRNTASAAPHPTAEITQQRAPASVVSKAPAYDHKRMLDTIAQVESSGGKNQNHKELAGIHHGESAFGKYGLTPVVMRETVHLNHDLQGKHNKLMALRGDDLHRYMQDNPGLEDTIADRHLQRLEHHFGKEPGTLGYAWLNGVSGTYNAKKTNKDIAGNWHVKKINAAYAQGK